METVEKLKARIRKEDAEADAARKKQIAASLAQTKNKNADFFAAEAERDAQAKANRPVVLPPKSNAEVEAEHAAKYPRPAVNKTAEGFDDPYGLVESKRNPSIVLTPAPDAYPAGDVRRGLSQSLMETMGLDPNPSHPATRSKK